MVDPERADDVRSPRRAAAWLVTMCFVSWSAATAASAIARERRPTATAPAPSDRSATEIGVERVGRRADADVGAGAPARSRRAPASRLQSMQSDAHGYASSRSSAISPPQFAHIPYVPSSIRSSAASISCEHLRRVLLERVVDLAVERRRRRLGEVVVARPRSTSSSSAAGMILAEVLDRAARRARAPRAAAARNWSVSMLMRVVLSARAAAAADASRRSMSAGPSPVSSTILSRAAVARDDRRRRCAGRASASASSRSDRVVRAAVLGRRGDAHLPRVAVPADDPALGRTGADAQPQPSGGRGDHRPSVSGELRRLGSAATSARGRAGRVGLLGLDARAPPGAARGSAATRGRAARSRRARCRCTARASACASVRISSASRRACSFISADARSAETSVVRSSASSSR